MPGSLNQRFAKDSSWSLVGAVASQGLGQVTFLVIARYLGTVGYGKLGMVLSTAGVFGLVAGTGMGLAATKCVAAFRTANPQKAGRIISLLSLATLITGGLACITVFLTSPFIAAFFLSAPSLAPQLRAASLLLLFNTINGVQVGVLSGLGAFKISAHLNALKGILPMPFIIAGAIVWGLPGAVCTYVAAAGVGCAMNRFAILRECRKFDIPLGRSGIWAERRVLWDFAVPSYLGVLVVSPAMWAASALLVHQPHGYDSMGLFVAADKWRLIIAFVPSATMAAVLSILANEAEKPCQKGYRRIFIFSLAVGIGLTVPAMAFVMLFSSRLMALNGEAFRRGSYVLVLLTLSSVPYLLNMTFGQVLISTGKVWARAWFDVFLGALLLASAAWFVPRHGAKGLAAAYVLAYSVTAALLVGYTFLHAKIPAFRREGRLAPETQRRASVSRQ